MKSENWVNASCESDKSKKNYRRALKQFLDAMHTDLETLLTTWRNVRYDLRLRDEFVEDWSERIEGYVNEKPFTSATKSTLFGMLKSFFLYCKVPVEVKLPKHVFITYHNRDVKRDEIRLILEHSGLRDRCFFLMMAESGLRPNTLTQLKWKHVKEEFLANKIPMKISLPSEILKCSVSERWTFIGEDSVKLLKEYLQSRMPMDNEDYLFVQQTSSRRNGKGLKRQDIGVTPEAFSVKFASLAKKLGLTEVEKAGKPKKLRLYALRKYFKKFATCERTFVEYWMGHTDTETHYISMDVEHHRKMYEEAYKGLRVLAPDLNTELLKNLNDEVAEKKQELADLSERVKKLEPLLKLVELLGVDDESTREKFFEELKTLKSAKLVATEKS